MRPASAFQLRILASSLIHHNSSFTYDPLGLTLTVRDHLNNTTTYTYDKVGNLLTTKAADNVVTSTRTYDALNRLLTDKDGKNQTISYAYDPLGRMTSYTDAKGATFAFGYDLLGRKILRTEPDTTWQSYTYDVAGRLLVHRKADGKTKTHIYGEPGRDFVTQITYSNGEPARLMSYDRLGRLTSAANGSSTVTRFYDEAGRLTGETQALAGGPTGSFIYEYNYASDDGNLKKHTRPDGSHIDYEWNARNLLTGITSDAPPPVATYSYNARNQIASTVIESGLFTAMRSYDAAGRLTGITNGTLDSTDYTLSPDGRRTGITRNGDTEAYGYDNARQVTSGNYGSLSTTQSWNYDPAGNRLTAVTNGATTTYQANAVNEYFSITGGGHVPPAPTYDDNGNATTWNVRPLGSPSLLSSVLAWNIHNELTNATNSTGDTASYAYDALGRRIKRVETIGGVTTTTWFFYNGWNVELEHNGTAYTRRHTWGLDLSNSLQGAGGVGGLVMVEHLPPLLLGEGGGEGGSGQPEPYFPTYDGNGNITAWADANGAVIARQRYDAFGNILTQTGIAPSNYAFSTKPQERVTGLYYYGYRYLDPVTGRWINRDPIEESGGMNLNGFVGNSGLGSVDFLGLEETAEKRDCRWTLLVGHGMHSNDDAKRVDINNKTLINVNLAIRKIAQIAQTPPKMMPGDKIGFHGCYRASNNRRLAEAVGEKHMVPSVERRNDEALWSSMDGTRVVARDNKLDFEKTLAELIPKVISDAKAQCAIKESCCKSIIIRFDNPDPEIQRWIFNSQMRLFGPYASEHEHKDVVPGRVYEYLDPKNPKEIIVKCNELKK